MTPAQDIGIGQDEFENPVIGCIKKGIVGTVESIQEAVGFALVVESHERDRAGRRWTRGLARVSRRILMGHKSGLFAVPAPPFIYIRHRPQETNVGASAMLAFHGLFDRFINLLFYETGVIILFSQPLLRI